MRIRSCRILFGAYAPDPTYKNLYNITCYSTTGKTPAEIAYSFFDELSTSFLDYTPIDRYDVPFATGAELYAISETERGFTVDLPTDDGFPERPKYMIVDTSVTEGVTNYRFAFILSSQRNAEYKIRCVCTFDQWTEHYSELMAAEMTFTRTHQKRYVDRTASPRVKIYNGLSDPIPEGMVQGKLTEEPFLAFGAKWESNNTWFVVPLWVYWRISNRDYYHKNQGADFPANPSGKVTGVDPMKSSIPVLAHCPAILMYKPSTGETRYYPTTIQNSDRNDVTTSPGLVRVLTYSHPYIVQATISTIPPCSVNLPGTVTLGNPTVRIIDTAFDAMIFADGSYRIGADMIPPVGTWIGFSNPGDSSMYLVPKGTRTTYTVTTDTDSSTFDDAYEPKIEETAFEQKMLSIMGADIDVSPSPTNPGISFDFELGAHGDIIFKDGNGNEVYRLAGNASMYGIDFATDSLASWMVSNFNTYQNARMFKQFNTNISSAGGFVSSVASKNAMGVIRSGMAPIYSQYEADLTERAMMKDMSNSPNATNVSSQNGIDHLPFVDLPRIKRRIIPSDIKSRIMKYWHVYGYPDNRTGKIGTDAITRQTFNFVQGGFLRDIPGVYPAEIADIVSAFRSGVWIWEPTFHGAVPPIPTPPGFVSHWITTERIGSDLATVSNPEYL